ncbi:MAG: hypothetical protein JJU37_15255 [Balneolaceae bacterium]|nr:hypothetical protein [Balneolaceae bacterium]
MKKRAETTLFLLKLFIVMIRYRYSISAKALFITYYVCTRGAFGALI